MTLLSKSSIYCALSFLVFLSLSTNAYAYKKDATVTAAPSTLSSNSHFCKCDTEGDRYMLVRVDISGGQKHETKVRDYLKGTHTLAQCEDGIETHPSCR